MGELIAAVIEALVGLVTAFVEVLPAVLEFLVYIGTASITIIAYAASPKYRARKRNQWSDNPKAKYLELGISAACLSCLVGLGAWLAWPPPEPSIRLENVRVEAGKTNEDLRVNLRAVAIEGTTNDVTLAVRKGGMKKIFQTETLGELGEAIRENVTVVGSEDELQPDDPAKVNQPKGSETNRTSRAADASR